MVLKETYNLVLCGDSISKGVVYDEEKGKYTTTKDNYASLIQDKIRGSIVNAGKFGNTITKAFERLGNDVLKNNPDIVLIEFGGNDCDFDWEEVARNPLSEHSPKTDYNVFKDYLTDLIDTLKENNIVPVLMSLPPIEAERYFRWISRQDLYMGSNILKWLGSINRIYWWQERYNSAVISTAQETNTPWIDIRSAFLQYPDYTKFICKDGIHPNEMGHRIIAGKILDYVKHYYNYLLKDSSYINYV